MIYLLLLLSTIPHNLDLHKKILYKEIKLSATMMCAEANHNLNDAEGVMQVAINRSNKWNKPISKIITARYQFSLNCRFKQIPIVYWLLALKAVIFRKMNTPTWLTEDVLFFNTRGYKFLENNDNERYIMVGSIANVYYKLKPLAPQRR